MAMKDDILDPREGGLSAKLFIKEYGMPKSKAKKILPRTAEGMNRGGMTMRKGNMAYNKGGMTMRKGNMAYNKGGYAKCGASYKG